MAFWNRRPSRQSEQSGSKPTDPHSPTARPEMIRVFDRYGREMSIARQEWRDKVLMGALEKAWNDPDQLYGLIAQALRDGL